VTEIVGTPELELLVRAGAIRVKRENPCMGRRL